MSVLDPKVTYRNLKNKGFIDAENKSKDHKWLHFFYNDKFILSTKMSHGAGDIGEQLIRAMSFQCHLTKAEFIDLARCPLSNEAYLEILEKKGLLK
jgi:hypothetical protein